MHTVALLTWSPLISGHLPASFELQIYLYVNWGGGGKKALSARTPACFPGGTNVWLLLDCEDYIFKLLCGCSHNLITSVKAFNPIITLKEKNPSTFSFSKKSQELHVLGFKTQNE